MMPAPKSWRPNSLRHLVFIAFTLIITPIGFMLYKTSIVLEQQLQQSYNQTQTALELNQQNNTLERLAEDIVRSASQYRIVKQEAIATRLLEQVEAYQNQLAVQMFISEQNTQKAKLISIISQLRETPLSEEINTLPMLTRELAETSHQKMIGELQSLQKQAGETRQALWLQTALLVMTTLGLMLFFSSVITRPIAELIRRIKSIGRREQLTYQTLRGPGEIVELDKQLLWLDNHLSELEQHKGLFIQHISHELKTPLTTLREGADLLAEEVPGPLNDRQHHVVGLLQSSSINLQKLIEQLLDYNRLQQPNVLKPQRVDLKKLISEAIGPLQLVISEKEINLKLPDKYPVIEQDIDMLKRVINNLISNAIYYTDKSGFITVATQSQGRSLIVDVENSGTPISAEDAERIFEPFYQGGKKRQGPLKGTGIGLSIAHEATKAMHGKLTLLTNKEGHIVFRLTLPLELK
ncbi:sensor histidine kinase [Neptunomonas concharum]|uniref:histidine kinase n=1 Tax=Neptunomonas concharum TaxID=1031538 RepID=A0A5P1RC79_9GAMM|nr:HAMP domain-containing sensor histidine kinase [Neptunomonas concharum]QEQ97274.1 HAMP domain-containing histidine kinase [Neptunomonas concharum]